MKNIQNAAIMTMISTGAMNIKNVSPLKSAAQRVVKISGATTNVFQIPKKTYVSAMVRPGVNLTQITLHSKDVLITKINAVMLHGNITTEAILSVLSQTVNHINTAQRTLISSLASHAVMDKCHAMV